MRLPDRSGFGWVDGRRVPLEGAGIGVDDVAFHAGIGLFETLAVRARRARELCEHLARLAGGAARLGIELPPEPELRRVVRACAAEQTTECGWLKVVVTGGGRWFVFGGAMDPAEEGRPVSAVLVPWRRNPHGALTGLKSLNYAENAIGADWARRHGADEGLWLNTRGHLAEGSASNLFVAAPGRLFTPQLRDGILGGVVRDLALRAARAAGLAVHEGRLRLVRLERAREAFLTSSLCGVRPLVQYEGRPVGHGTPGPVTRTIQAAVAEMRTRAAESAIV